VFLKIIILESKYTKLYYSIGEVAEMLNVSTSLIRYWDKEFGSILKLKKNNKGNRLFTGKEIDKLIVIQELLKVKGFTIQGAKNYLKENKYTEFSCNVVDTAINNDKNKYIDNKSEIIELLKTIKETLRILIEKKF